MAIQSRMLSAPALFVLLAVAFLGSPTVAEAATFVVNSTSDVPDFLPGDGVCDSTSGSGTCTLRAAIMEANATAGADIITLPAGTYSLTFSGVGEDAARTGDLDITESVTINGAGRATTIITGVTGAGNDRVLDVIGTTPVVAVAGATITRGQCCTTGGDVGGGAIRNAGDLTLTDVTVSNSSANIGLLSGIGGGIISSGASSRLTLLRTEVSDNSAVGVAGGIFVDGGTATISDSQILRNNAAVHPAGGSGGAIFSSGVLTLTNSLVAENSTSGTSTAGAGIVSFGPLTMTRTTVRDNSANGILGALSASGPTTITDSTFLRNRQFDLGGTLGLSPALGQMATLQRVQITDSYGSLSVDGPGTVLVRDSLFSDNGASLRISSTGVAQISNTTITRTFDIGINNSGSLVLKASLVSESSLSAIANQTGATATLENVTISGNDSFTMPGAAIQNAGMLTVTSTTIAGNLSRVAAGQSVVNATGGTLSFRNTSISGAIDAPLCLGAITSLGHNLETGTSCGFNAPGDIRRIDPQMTPLANHGGQTLTHRLLAGSPAIDAGDNTGCPSTDQRGQPRPRDGDGNASVVCDIGAYELQDPYPVTPTPCAPRPPIALQTAKVGPSQIRGTLTASQTTLLPSNTLTQLQVTGLANATITVNGVAAIAGQTITLPAAATSATVVVTRVAAGQAFTARILATDACGAWPTFLGGGTGVS